MAETKKTKEASAAAAVAGSGGFTNLESWRFFGLGLNQKQMADLVGVSQGMISALETGRSKRPTEIAKYWAAYLLSPEEFYRLFRGSVPSANQESAAKVEEPHHD